VATSTPIYLTLIIAFGVVILTTLGNTLLEWFRQHSASKRAALILRRALLEELKLARETADTNGTRCDDPPEGGSLIVPVAETFRIYDANINNLGHLQPDEVSAVVRAYAMLQAQVETLAVIGTFHRPEGVILQAIVDARWAALLASNNRDLSASLNSAVTALERRC
jgi:hypothetical protein